jgi:hypothetical protein
MTHKFSNLLRSPRYERAKNNFETFFLKPASPLPLAIMRMLLALVLLMQAWFLKDAVIPLLSRSGLVQGPLADALRMPYTPTVGWIAQLLAPFGVSEVTCLLAICAAYVVSLLLFGLGLFTRFASISTWLLHWVLMITGYSSAYGVDLYAHVFLFYMMFMPSGAALSLDNVFAGRSWYGTPSWAARLALRTLQLHLCVSYAMSAIEKVQGVQWRTGEVLWRSLSLPIFQQFDMNWIAQWPKLLFAASWATLILEGFFFIFIWPRATRKLWIAGVMSLHIGIAIFLGLHLFGLIMCVLVASAFAVPADVEFEPARADERALEKANRQEVAEIYDSVWSEVR